LETIDELAKVCSLSAKKVKLWSMLLLLVHLLIALLEQSSIVLRQDTIVESKSSSIKVEILHVVLALVAVVTY
jgi:hypothetical protein